MPWAVEEASGEIRFMDVEPTYRSEEDPGNGRSRGVRTVEVARLPGPDEVYDFDAGAFSIPPERAELRVNLEHDAERGPFATAVAHAVKLVEARMLLGEPTSIELEATRLGRDPQDLARLVLERAEHDVTAELDRIEQRARARGDI